MTPAAIPFLIAMPPQPAIRAASSTFRVARTVSSFICFPKIFASCHKKAYHFMSTSCKHFLSVIRFWIWKSTK